MSLLISQIEGILGTTIDGTIGQNDLAAFAALKVSLDPDANDKRKMIQKLLLVTADGDFGPQTTRAFLSLQGTTKYGAILTPIGGKYGPAHGVPPTAFIDQVVTVFKTLPAEVFLENDKEDIYAALKSLAYPPPEDPSYLLFRKAVLAYALIVAAGYESGWDWLCGADPTAGPETLVEQETGAFQVSANSMNFDSSLKECVARYNGGSNTPAIFIFSMKRNHALAVEYAARLFRFNTRWSGPTNEGWLNASMSIPAIRQLETLIQS